MKTTNMTRTSTSYISFSPVSHQSKHWVINNAKMVKKPSCGRKTTVLDQTPAALAVLGNYTHPKSGEINAFEGPPFRS